MWPVWDMTPKAEQCQGNTWSKTKYTEFNEAMCAGCQKWVHRTCSGINGSMYKVIKTFVCSGCVNPVTGTGRTSVDIGFKRKSGVSG